MTETPDNAYEQEIGMTFDTAELVPSIVFAMPLQTMAAAFPEHQFSVGRRLMFLTVDAIGLQTRFHVLISPEHDELWHQERLATIALHAVTLDYIGRRLINVAVQKNFIDESLLTVRERGIRTPFSVHSVEPYELRIDRLLQLLMIHLKLTENDVAPILQIEPMAPRRRKTPTDESPQLFRCHVIYKNKRADAAIFCTSIEQATKHALIHLLVGLTQLKE